MGYQGKLKGVAIFKKGKLLVVWQYVFHYVIRCLSGRTGGIDNMGIPLLEIVWSIFTGNPVNYGNNLWEDFLQYISKGNPKERMLELTSARFWSLCLVDLHKDANLSLGNDTKIKTSVLVFYSYSVGFTILSPDSRVHWIYNSYPSYYSFLEDIRTYSTGFYRP